MRLVPVHSGSPTLDFEALESATVYEDGYVADSDTVRGCTQLNSVGPIA